MTRLLSNSNLMFIGPNATLAQSNLPMTGRFGYS